MKNLPTAVGALILAAATNANILQTGGYLTSHAILVGALSIGVFAGAWVLGTGAGRTGLVILAALVAGESYNFFATGERIVIEREAGAAPLKDAAAKHVTAVAHLHELQTSVPSSRRLQIAQSAKVAADAAYEKELREGGRCKTICTGLKAKADEAQAEVVAALSETQALNANAIEVAKTDIAANPLPASATPLADRLGWPAWVLDLIMAGLLSIGANGLAGVLVAFGASKHEIVIPAAQSNFDPTHAENITGCYRPDNGGQSDSPKPGPTGLSKAQAFDDLMQRLADGRNIGSQDELASDWHRPKQTVSDWMKEWRRIGIIPPPIRTGRCNATVVGRFELARITSLVAPRA